MLSNNIAFLYVHEKSLEMFQQTSCEIGMMIGHVSLI